MCNIGTQEHDPSLSEQILKEKRWHKWLYLKTIMHFSVFPRETSLISYAGGVYCVYALTQTQE